MCRNKCDQVFICTGKHPRQMKVNKSDIKPTFFITLPDTDPSVSARSPFCGEYELLSPVSTCPGLVSPRAQRCMGCR